MSESKSSLPSQSTFKGSSIDTSSFVLLFLLKYISISFSIQRDAYVASFMFLSVLNVFIPLIRPIVPIDIKSSTPTPVLSNFFAMYTTSLKLCSINILLADSSFSFINFSNCFASSSPSSGAGSTSGPPI